jgi:putative ATP-binding cassette transporter
MRVIKWLLGESITRFSLACLASAASGILTIGILILLFRLIGKDEEVRLELFVALSVGAIGSRALSRKLIGSIGRDAILFLRVELFRRIMDAPLADIERIGRSKMVMALTDDIGRIAAIVPNLVVLCTNVALILAFLAYLGWLSVTQLGITIAVVAAGLACHWVLRREGTRQMRVSRQKRSDLLEMFRSFLDGIKELKLNAVRRGQALEEFAERANELQTSVHRQVLFFGGSATVAQIIFYVALGLVMFGYTGGGADRQLVASYGIAVVYLMGPIQGTIGIVQELVAADIALDRVEELGIRLEIARADQKGAGAIDRNADLNEIARPFDTFRDLELSGITYLYTEMDDEAEFVLGPIDLSLARGEILFVVGGNGSGKTTFAKVLAGLYAPAAGCIRINGHVVTSDDAPWYCQLFSVVFHDFFLFDRLLERNELSDELTRRFEIEGRVQIEDKKIVNSSALSAGERKRLALMLAYLDDKPIVIFDEWAANQDSGFRQMFYNEVLQELRSRGKLVVVISHDDRYFRLADRILVLERGRASSQSVAVISSDEQCA